MIRSLVSLALLAALPALDGCASAPRDRVAVAEVPDRHSRPIVEEGGRTLLWAREDDDGAVEWFDMTDAAVDPAEFQFGIGKDTIPSIDAPEFALFDDPVVAKRGITAETPVLGIYIDGVARAYPVDLMSMHEVVNDEINGKAFAVLW